MLAEIFYWILNMSVLGSVTGIVVLLLRRAKRLPKLFIYCLWGIPLLRLWVPLGMTSKYSLMTLISQFTTRTVTVYEPAGLPPLAYTNFIMAAEEYFPIVYKTNLLASVFAAASIVWVIIACASFIAAILLYHSTKSEIKTATILKDNICVSANVTSPAVYGILKPRILLPDKISNEDIDYVIRHEEVHLRRKDNLLRCLAIVTACIHWFNPLVWYFLKCFFEDMELACDAKVLNSLNSDNHKKYANAIVKFAASKTFLVSAFGGAKVRVRVENILSYKKLTAVSGVCFTILLAVIAAVLLANAQV